MTLRRPFWELWHVGRLRGGSDKTPTTPGLWLRLRETLDNQHRGKKINCPPLFTESPKGTPQTQARGQRNTYSGQGQKAPPKLLQGCGFSTSTRTKLPSTATTPPHHICRIWAFKIPVPKLTKSLTLARREAQRHERLKPVVPGVNKYLTRC